MKKLISIFFTFLFIASCFSQSKRANNWYFGNQLGLTFNTEPPTVLRDGKMVTDEGCSTISDENGNLLFYTDGIGIWNKQHKTMPNGTGLKGNSSSTQSGVIVPYPEHSNLYYIFTVDSRVGAGGFCYSIVDMNLENGLGDVIQKNTQLITSSSEKITAILHQNKKDIWVIAHHFSQNKFYSYLVTSSGISTTPIISQTGLIYNILNADDAMGYLKASPNGKKIAVTIESTYLGSCAIYDFNNKTGQMTLIRSFNNYQQCYGLEFSPDNSKLYFSASEAIYQLNLKNSNALPVKIGTYSWFRGALQLAPNGKIYFIEYQTSLNVIDNPNAEGTACNYSKWATLGLRCKVGLPTYIQSYFLPILNFTFLNTCQGTPIFFALSGTDVKTALWDFGDSTSSTEINPSHTYSQAGTYNVQVTVTYEDGTSQSLTKTITIIEKPKTLTINHN